MVWSLWHLCGACNVRHDYIGEKGERLSCLIYDVDKQKRKIAFILEVGDEDEFMSPPKPQRQTLTKKTHLSES